MKKVYFLLTSLLFQSYVSASPISSGIEVCHKIGESNKVHEKECAELLSKSDFSESSFKLAYQVALTSSFHAVRILEVTANKVLEDEVAVVCEKVAENNLAYAVDCAKYAAGAYFYSPLTEICFDLATLDDFSGMKCVQTIANKISKNNAEQICKSTARTDAADTLRCLSKIVTDYAPQRRTIEVDVRRLEALRMSILRARGHLRRGEFQYSDMTLGNSLYSLDLILSGGN